MTASDPALLRDAEGRPIFRHRPRLVGPQITFTLEDRDLAWSDGRSSGRLPLHQIESVRLVFRPANLHMQRYRCEVRQRLGRRVWFSNVSWRGMMDVEAHDAAFTAFVRAVLAAVAAASPKARFLAGEPAWRYAAVAAVTAALALALGSLAVHAVRELNWTLMGLVAGFGAYAAWQMGLWLAKNRPACIDPLAPPAALLPEAGTAG